MAEVEPYAVIEAFTNRVGHLTQELMVAQAFIASLESDVTKLRATIAELEPKTGYNPEHSDEAYDPGMPEKNKPDFFFQAGDYTNGVPTVALLSKRQARALALSVFEAGTYSTLIEGLMTGNFDHMSDEDWEAWMRNRSEYDKRTKGESDGPVADAQPVEDEPVEKHAHKWKDIRRIPSTGQIEYECAVCGAQETTVDR